MQNLGKQEIVIHLVRRMENRKMKAKGFMPVRVLPSLRYLGGIYETGTNNKSEREARIRALRVGWFQMGTVWFAPLPHGVKRLLFTMKVMAPAVSVFGAARTTWRWTMP